MNCKSSTLLAACGAGSMNRSSVRRPFAACGGFAAERRAGRKYRSTAAAAGRRATAAPQHGIAALRSAANARKITSYTSNS